MIYGGGNGLWTSLGLMAAKDSFLPCTKRIKFIFQKSRIDVIRSLLDSSKTTLSLLLVTLNLETASSSKDRRQ